MLQARKSVNISLLWSWECCEYLSRVFPAYSSSLKTPIRNIQSSYGIVNARRKDHDQCYEKVYSENRTRVCQLALDCSSIYYYIPHQDRTAQLKPHVPTSRVPTVNTPSRNFTTISPIAPNLTRVFAVKVNLVIGTGYPKFCKGKYSQTRWSNHVNARRNDHDQCYEKVCSENRTRVCQTPVDCFSNYYYLYHTRIVPFYLNLTRPLKLNTSLVQLVWFS